MDAVILYKLSHLLQGSASNAVFYTDSASSQGTSWCAMWLQAAVRNTPLLGDESDVTAGRYSTQIFKVHARR